MKPTNAVPMDFYSSAAMEEFIAIYEREAPSLYLDAKLHKLVKTEKASFHRDCCVLDRRR